VHDAPILYIPISISSMDAQTLGGEWIGLGPMSPSRFSLATTDADTSYATRAVTHRVANVGTLPFRLIAVTNGRPRAELDAGPVNEPPPGVLEHNSSWFYQTRVSLPAGGTTPPYTSSSDVVLVQPGSGQVHVDYPSISSSRVLDGAGSFTFLPPGAGFMLRNASAEPTTVVIVRVR
jgi:mannose-6-phosphate isomerase-like protein (cupin superfamily)